MRPYLTCAPPSLRWASRAGGRGSGRYRPALPGAGAEGTARSAIAALQDDDLELPGHIELAYYDSYNLYRSVVEGTPIDDWLIVNQALAAEEDPALWRMLLADTLQAAQQ